MKPLRDRQLRSRDHLTATSQRKSAFACAQRSGGDASALAAGSPQHSVSNRRSIVDLADAEVLLIGGLWPRRALALTAADLTLSDARLIVKPFNARGGHCAR